MGTFKRQQSELRDRLEPVKPNQDERRAVSVDRRRNTARNSSTGVVDLPRLSAPELLEKARTIESVLDESGMTTKQEDGTPELVELLNDASNMDMQSISGDSFDEIDQELESRWILNLSMQ